MNDITKEDYFQKEIEAELEKNGWVRGESKKYDQINAIYGNDLIDFYTCAYPEEWEKYKKFFNKNPEEHFVKFVLGEIEKKPRGTLDIFRGELRDRGVKIRLSAPFPSHGMSEDSISKFNHNIFRVVREVVYSPNGSKNRIDLVLFLNGLPVATIETKSEFKQDVQNAVKQYRHDRMPIDPVTKKKEPLLSFKRGALVHFAVGENEIFMTTKLEGWKTAFLPFNRGKDGLGAGNKIPMNGGYPVKYLWEEVLQKKTLINIIHNFIHFDRKQVEDESGRIFYKESLVFPRYHQLEAVNKLIETSSVEGPGNTYLIQHSAGSGKSNSIAWLAHQLANLYKDDKRVFDTVIVVTDRRVLDSQLQDTIFQFEHKKGVVSRIGHKEELNRASSKSEQLAKDLISGTNIVIVTIQTFPFIVDAIKEETSLNIKNFAIIADEAHSSQTGKGASKIKLALSGDMSDIDESTSEDVLNEFMNSRGRPKNISYYAFTATPKAKTLEIFGRCPDPTMPISEDNKPRPFHLYSMKQAIEEGFIRDVLQNYTTYKVLYELATNQDKDKQVDSKKAKKKIAQFARIHPHNISQKIQIMIEHFKENVAERLDGQAKGMVITSSRLEAVRYKLKFDEYIKEKGYRNLQAIVAFSGEVEDKDFSMVDSDGKSKSFTEQNMNSLSGREIPEAFDSEDFQVLLVANKYQTGFDQPKLCAMYVDKKLGGVDCVQTLSRLNRNYPGKSDSDVFILDFCNDPKDIEEAFKPYYGETSLGKPSNPNLVYEIKDNILEEDFIYWNEVESFCDNYNEGKDNRSLLNNFVVPARDRFNNPYKTVVKEIKRLKNLKREMDDKIQLQNIETQLNELNSRRDNFEKIKKYCTTYLRTYDFITQIIQFNDIDLEKFYVYLQALSPMLGRGLDDDESIDLSGLKLSKYRIQKIKTAKIVLTGEAEDVDGVTVAGTGAGRSEEQRLLSEIIKLINELSGANELTDEDKVKYFKDIEIRIQQNANVLEQIRNNTKEQMREGSFKNDLTNIIIENMGVNDKHRRMGEDLLGKDILLDNLADKLLERLYNKFK